MVYVDDMNAPFGRMKMCHMIADTTEELLAMVDKINVQRKWIQHPGTLNEHFDICLQKKVRALDYGAKEITWRGYAKIIEDRCIKAGIHFALASKHRIDQASLTAKDDQESLKKKDEKNRITNGSSFKRNAQLLSRDDTNYSR